MNVSESLRWETKLHSNRWLITTYGYNKKPVEQDGLSSWELWTDDLMGFGDRTTRSTGFWKSLGASEVAVISPGEFKRSLSVRLH